MLWVTETKTMALHKYEKVWKEENFKKSREKKIHTCRAIIWRLQEQHLVED